MTRVLLIICLAASAGAHVALAASHGPSFHVAAALLALAAGTIVVAPRRLPALAAAVLQAGLLVAYVAFRGSEAVDSVAAVTKTVEAAGLVLSLRLASMTTPRHVERAATFVLAASIAVMAAVATPAAEHDHPPGAATHGH